MPCSWEGNRRSGVAVAMRHRLQWFGLTVWGREMSTQRIRGFLKWYALYKSTFYLLTYLLTYPAYTAHGAQHTLLCVFTSPNRVNGRRAGDRVWLIECARTWRLTCADREYFIGVPTGKHKVVWARTTPLCLPYAGCPECRVFPPDICHRPRTSLKPKP